MLIGLGSAPAPAPAPGYPTPHIPPGSTQSPHPLLTLLLAAALKVVLPLRILDEACRGRGPSFSLLTLTSTHAGHRC